MHIIWARVPTLRVNRTGRSLASSSNGGPAISDTRPLDSSTWPCTSTVSKAVIRNGTTLRGPSDEEREWDKRVLPAVSDWRLREGVMEAAMEAWTTFLHAGK